MNKTLTVESNPELELRTTNLSPIEILALSTQINFDKFDQTAFLFTFALEHTEVKIGEAWVPVKVPKKEVYAPIVENNFMLMNEIITVFLSEVVTNTFQESAE